MTIQLLAGDARDVLPTLAADSVHTVVTSPPYLGLRDYGTALWDGGDAACSHVAGNARGDTGGGTHNGNSVGFHGGSSNGATRQFRDTCGKCGARRIDRQIGLESSPDEYLATMVAVFREVRRVLHPTGTVFCNMGDGYRDKQLLLMPARLALALQADGWWVRSDIIWHKPNPMPESCTDRPTSAHEHVFLLTKSARYFYDADAVREAQSEGTHERFGKNPAPASKQKLAEAGSGIKNNGSFHLAMKTMMLANGRAMRNVWTIATHAYPDAHFATFPPELAERCIRAGTSERGCCVACGAPWRRQIEKEFRPDPRSASPEKAADRPKPLDSSNGWNGLPRGATSATTTGWAPGCDHNADVVPCRVLDPFFGAGTTGLVAERLQRDCIGIDLNPDYNAMSRARIEADAPLFTSFPPAEPPEDERIGDLFADAAE